jgi:hypothetical protein
MNTTTIAPEVQEFLDAVRTQLADLDPDEQREILDGLEADLTDLVTERGRGALGDPVAYAGELRAAAGLEPARPRSRAGRSAREWVHAVLDGSAERWRRVLAALPGDAEEFLAALCPAWWVLRAWLAVQTVALVLGVWALTIVPGETLAGVGAIAVAVVLSVQLGRGRLWPAERWRRAASLRVLLLGLNLLAVAMVPGVLNGLEHGQQSSLEDAYAVASPAPADGLQLGGEPVRNIYPYDAQGHPLTGIQLVDSSGHPLAVTDDPYDEDPGWGDFLLVPWLNGKSELFNVFPLAEQRVDPSTQQPVGVPALQSPPLASLPPVSLAGVAPSLLQPPKR